MKIHVLVILIVASILVEHTQGLRNRICRRVSDCPCGSQCVTRIGSVPCGRGLGGRFCECRRGCVVGNIFIQAGYTNSNTYCNSCSCPINPASSDGKALCTRVAWCGLPKRYPTYVKNPKC